MPKITLRNENEIIKAVREEIVMDPMISVSRLRKNLKERGITTYNGNSIDPVYLARIVRKIARRAMQEADNTKIEHRLSKTRERFSVMIDRLMKIAFWRPEYIKDGIWPPQTKDIVRALDTVQKMDLALLQAEMDAGIFERRLGTLDIEVARKQSIPENAREVAWRTFQNWGIVPQEAEMPKIQNGEKQHNQSEQCRELAIIK